MRNLKLMGVAVIAVLAMSAMVASAASAASYKSSPSGTTWVTGVQTTAHNFTAGAGVSCATATGQGEFTSPATSLTATNIVYGTCKIAGQNATVNMNGCDYLFGTPSGASSPFTLATITIQCPTGKSIVITATTAGCTISVPGQVTTGTSTVVNNAGSPSTVNVNANISGISYTGTGGVCGTSGSTASYTGGFKVSGFSDSTHKTPVSILVG